jgi:hypothetical protein
MADIFPSDSSPPISPSALGSNLQRPTHQFKTFNDDFFKKGSSTSTSNQKFPLFSRLPLDLRLKIWTTHLQRHRFLRINILSFQADSGYGASRSTNCSNNEDVVRDQEYCIFLRNLPTPCALSRVCHEAAETSREFYRVHLPCYLNTSKEQRKTKGLALLNPEWDILDIHLQSFDNINTLKFIHFLHDLRSRDPRNQGALNLSLHIRQAKVLADLNLLSLSTIALDSYKHIIASLHRLFWRSTPLLEGRIMSGFLSHTRTIPWYNVSMPLMANSASIEFIGPDPRVFQPDMHQVWVGDDPRVISVYWDKIEKALEVRAGEAATGQAFQCRILLALETWEEPDQHQRQRHSIVDSGSVCDYLLKESKQWCSLLDKSSQFGELLESAWYRAQEKYTPNFPPVCPWDIITTRLDRTAVGFWLFEPKAFPELGSDPFTGANHEGKTVVNMVGQYPELCLFDIHL